MENKAFDELMAITGHTSEDLDGRVKITERDPVLPTVFKIGETAAGVIAACGAAVSDLWKVRTGRDQQIEVNARAAAASLQSFAYLSLADGGRTPRPPNITDFYSTRDGRWFFLHCSFPPTHERTLKLLGCENEKESAANAVLKWDAATLEDTFADAGLCGGMVRDAGEWLNHPQGSALTELPVVEILKIGDSDPEPLRPGDRPLSGLRVLDLTRVLAGPACGRTLAEHGADVLRIASPDLPSIDWFVMDTGHGKRSAFLDLEKENDSEKLRALVQTADVFSQSYRLGALAGRGFSPETLAELRPGIIYTSMNCYGHVGPWRGRRGWEQLAQTVAGLSMEHGGATGPRLLPAAVNDYITGYLGAFGTLVALKRRALEGGSYMVRASLCQSAMLVERMGRVPDVDAAAQKPSLPTDEITGLTVETETPFGLMTHLAPVVRLSETPARWALPVVPLGTHAPEWLDS